MISNGFCGCVACVCSQVGKTCKLLQGPDTQQAALNALNASLEAKRSLKISLINYTRDGEPFHNAIECGPVEGGSHFVATISSTPIKDGSVAPLPVPMSALVPEAERGPSEPDATSTAHARGQSAPQSVSSCSM